MQVFEERRKPEYPGKTSQSREENQLTQNTPTSGNEPGPPWWDASALTTTPPPLSMHDPTHWLLLFLQLSELSTHKRGRWLILHYIDI